MSRRRTAIFGGLVAFFVVFWLAGQAATLRWQVRHLVTHTPEVVEDGRAVDDGAAQSPPATASPPLSAR